MTDLTDLKSLQKRPQHKSITDLKSKCKYSLSVKKLPWYSEYKICAYNTKFSILIG